MDLPTLVIFSCQWCGMMIVNDQSLWLQCMNRIIGVSQIPGAAGKEVRLIGSKWMSRPVAVKDYTSDLTIIGAEFADLPLVIDYIGIPVRLISRMVPIE